MDSPIPATPLALEGDNTIDVFPTRDSEITMRAGGSPAVTERSTIPTSSSIQQAAMNRVLLGQMGNSVTDVEIGGGKIQGREIIPGRGQIQFAMYNARQYEKPEGHFTEQTSRDGEKWYKGLRNDPRRKKRPPFRTNVGVCSMMSAKWPPCQKPRRGDIK